MKKITIKISPIEHRGKKRIKVTMKWEVKAIELIKKVKGRLWSQTKGCWHVPYTTEAYEELKGLFEVHIEEAKTEEELPKKPKAKQELVTVRHKFVSGNKIIVQKANEKWLNALVPYDKKGWIEVMTNIPGRKWDAEEKYWVLPNVKETYWILKRHVGMAYLDFEFEIEADIPEIYRPSIKATRQNYKKVYPTFEKLNDIQQGEVLKLVEKLTLERLSTWTIKSYRNNLAALFFFYKNEPPTEITKDQVSKYLLHLIRFKKITESTQNQIINSIKAYWERVLNREKEWIEIKRPKKPKKLPNVLSTEEVVDLIWASDNLKHKLALLLIYSAGLRKAELLNLLKRDINIKRRSIHVKSGKGKKDRYVVLAETVVPFLKDYLKQYRPARWLFEGRGGGKYSGSSLQRLFEKALEKSQVNPYATIHTLRHSYATHCIEQGHHIKQVQDALGHNSIKTTEVYLHISSDALNKLKSPLDNLKIK